MPKGVLDLHKLGKKTREESDARTRGVEARPSYTEEELVPGLDTVALKALACNDSIDNRSTNMVQRWIAMFLLS